ncbi:uncharacterized protein NFIA_052860 [Aspergillus fischeri NRRL 181]|uniref:Peptidase S8/S53 domain-containing protein n=1 Tax=Neosartorya fischeri (strain ATCC 1020 / DSM 3700 / CBS 544.65 / FGSC A1164 / JCM 1740 / NRRL 181 / WB 181) TaxID=331117 RepID=A1DMB9_NEOFI|nr:uncharacterized protein NFIA_052860 [Aspergillus fischeri NRRL 181]EAW15940.1 hypothetical protein NFIA_052860 [Aspergillus fischeri NRRL 181]
MGGEVLAPGTEIEIHSPRPVNPQCARSAVIVTQDGRNLFVPVTVDQEGTTIRICTDDLGHGSIYKLMSVNRVFLDDRTGLNDLVNSEAIGRAAPAQALGYTGLGVRVAVFEAGPSDLTYLAFDGRYTESPEGNDHARLTSAIIKNVEPGKPHGYAPNCSLYSANSYDNAVLRWADRKLPELAANGTGVTAVGLTMSGTSFSASAVAGTAALLQRVNLTLKSWPEGCKAILLASAGPTVSGDTWAEDNLRGIDQSDGSGALNAEIGVLIAQHRQWRDLPPAPRGWDVGSLKDNDFASQSMSKFFYKVAVPDPDPAIARNIYTVKVALAWDAKFPSNVTRVQSPTITFLLAIYKSNGGRPGTQNVKPVAHIIAKPQPGTSEYCFALFTDVGNIEPLFAIALC